MTEVSEREILFKVNQKTFFYDPIQQFVAVLEYSRNRSTALVTLMTRDQLTE